MAETGICVSVGKCVGSAYRSVAENTQRVGHLVGTAARTVAEETAGIAARVANLFKRVKGDSRLAQLEMRQKDEYAKLGQEAYRLKGAELETLLPADSVRGILAEVREGEEKIREIRESMQAQQKRMQELVVYKHALRQLRNPDPRVRRAALRVIERLRDKDAMSEVIRLLDDPDAEVRIQAQGAIQKLTETGQGRPVQAAAPAEEDQP